MRGRGGLTLRNRVLTGVLFLMLGAGCTGAPDPNALMTGNELRALAPTMDGWERGALHTQTIDVPEVASVLTVSYTRADGEQLDLEISDTAGKSSMIESLAKMAGSEFNREMESGYLKGTTVAGAPAVEALNTQNRIGELTVLVRNRYIIHVGGKNLADAAPMRAIVERIDISKLR
jgi:hypothetical protein